MTAVVALVGKNYEIFMGADAAGVSGWDMLVRKNGKVFPRGEYLIGCAGSTRVSNVLQHTFNPPEAPNTLATDMFRFMVNEFVDELRECLQKTGVASKEKETESTGGGWMLVGARGRLFHIYSDYSVGEDIQPYSSIGVGAPYALGVLHAFHNTKTAQPLVPYSPVDVLYAALEAAEQFSCGVRGPYHFVSSITKR